MSFLKSLKENKIFLFSFVMIIISYILRIIIIYTSTLIDDEAYYALWTHHLPLGFFDHGAGIAYFMKPTMMIFGDNGFGVRIGSIIMMIITSFFIYRFCKKHKDENTGIIVVILFNTIPFFAGLALIVTIDTPMFFFLVLSIMAYYEAIYSSKKFFYLAGALIGFAVLSKISAVIIGGCVVLFMLLSSRRKEILKSKEFYLSFLVAFIVYLPFTIYTINTKFAPVVYILNRLGKNGSLSRTGDFWGAQLGLLGVGFFIFFIVVIVIYILDFIKKRADEKDLFFMFVSFLPFVYLIQKSFKNKLEANWALFAYVGALFLVGFFIAKRWDKSYMRKLFTANVILCSFMTFFIIFLYFFDIVNIKGNPVDRYFRYNSIRYDMKEYYENNMDKNLRIFGLNYQNPSMVNFYVKPDIESVTLNFATYHPTVFDFWYNDDEFVGTDMYYLGGSKISDAFKNRFDEVTLVTNFVSYRGDRKLATFSLFLCKNYKGSGLEYIYDTPKIKIPRQ